MELSNYASDQSKCFINFQILLEKEIPNQQIFSMTWWTLFHIPRTLSKTRWHGNVILSFGGIDTGPENRKN